MTKLKADEALPDFIEVFRIIRAAGRSNREKAQAIWERLETAKAAMRGDLF